MKRKLLFDHDSPELDELKTLVSKQTHRVLIAWAFDCAAYYLKLIEERCPDESRPEIAYHKAKEWASGLIKMPEAKRAILAAHQAANEIDDMIAIALIRAVAQGVSTVHTPKHAMGVVFYGLTALYYDTPIEKRTSLINDKIKWFYDRLLYWQDNTDKYYHKWASFIKA